MPRQTRYRGRRQLTKALAGIGITVLVVSALLGTAYLFLRDFVSFTDDGILLALPFLNGKSINRSNAPSVTPSPSPDVEDITIVIEGTPSPTAPPPPPSPSPSPELPLSAVFLPQSGLAKTAKIDEIAALCESGAADTVVIEVKSPDGVIVTKQNALKNAVEALSGKARLVAYMSILHDNTVTRNEVTFGIKYISGVNWLDSNKSRWINPFVPETREWLVQQVAACAELPFDAFLFDTLWFPPEGKLETIAWGQYEGESRSEALKNLTDELTAAVSVPCWAVIQTDVLNNTVPQSENAAQDFEYSKLMYGRLFTRLADADPENAFPFEPLPSGYTPEATPQ